MKFIFAIVNVLLLVGTSYLGVQTYGLLTTSPARFNVPVPTNPMPTNEKEKQSVPASYEAIVQRNLFGTPTEDASVPAKVDLETLEQTKLNLKLWGTVTGSAREPYAVIEEKGKRRQNLYRVKDTVQNATIKLILREKVVLTVEGRDEVLEMEKVTAKESASRPLPTTTVSAPAAPPQPDGSQMESDQPTGEEQIVLDRTEMEAAMQNVNELMRQVRIRPHFRDGKPDGLSFTGIRPDSIFRKMGLRNGDVVTGVNEGRVENMNDAVGLFQELGNADGLELKIKRRGQDQLLKYSME